MVFTNNYIWYTSFHGISWTCSKCISVISIKEQHSPQVAINLRMAFSSFLKKRLFLWASAIHQCWMHWSNIGFCIILSVLLALGKLLHRQGNKSSTPSHYSFPDVNITSDLPVAGSNSGVINSSRGKPSQREKPLLSMNGIYLSAEQWVEGRNQRIKCSLNISIMYTLTCQVTQFPTGEQVQS